MIVANTFTVACLGSKHVTENNFENKARMYVCGDFLVLAPNTVASDILILDMVAYRVIFLGIIGTMILILWRLRC